MRSSGTFPLNFTYAKNTYDHCEVMSGTFPLIDETRPCYLYSVLCRHIQRVTAAPNTRFIPVVPCAKSTSVRRAADRPAQNSCTRKAR